MSVTAAYERLARTLEGEVLRDEPMARHTSLRTGGPATLFVVCDSLRDLSEAETILDEEGLESRVVGKGTNLLVSDEGIDGAVIVLGKEFRRHSVDGTHITAGAGASLASLVKVAYEHGLAGLAFAVGIPGTLGGALAMNAGSRDDWIGEITESVTILSPHDGLLRLAGDGIPWGYRRSGLSERGIIVEAVLATTAGEPAAIRGRMERGFRDRKSTQPVGVASAGSVFKNPEGDSAGRLIEAAGLKGERVGGARVSEVHANFIVNEGDASATDVWRLAQRVKERVKEVHDVELEKEIEVLGSFSSRA